MRSKDTETRTADQAYRYALRLMTGRDYSVARLQQRLVGWGVVGDVGEQVISRLQREGWLDDGRYAVRFAESALATGRFCGARLRIEMQKRGFGPDLVQETLAPLLQEYDEIPEVKAAVERRYPDFVYAHSSPRDRQRVFGFLQRRGFGFAAILRALKAEDQW